MHPLTQKERSLDTHVRFFAESRSGEAAMRATRLGCHMVPSEANDEAEWLGEILLISLGRFMFRSDAMAFATALGSTTLFLEALTADQHWIGRAFQEVHMPPLIESLDEMAIEFETWAVDHVGPRHDPPRSAPNQGGLFDLHREAA